MNLPREIKALAWAVGAAALSFGGTVLSATAIRQMPVSSEAFMPPAGSPTDIIVSPALAAQGHEFYEMSCSHCHADDATGDEGPSLHNLTISDARIASTIKNGVKGEMPSFAKKYDAAQVNALVSYLRTLH